MENRPDLKLVAELENRIKDLKIENEILKSKNIDLSEDVKHLKYKCFEKDSSMMDIMINNKNLRIENNELRAMFDFIKDRLEKFVGSSHGRN
ncbi:TPA: hypothetical protein VBN28_001130 [Streptococcus agalactiae]|uniref:hypothetical protein n=1 Tax=Streptococcus agalactiae TaxID=1311 RepID=UPI0008106B7B|nr:hypothetical protein [Streptococcus agalactiae]OCL81396.1 hypothetical protein AX255_00710 [Streptococcus agalactiae]HEO7943834.1 hypothetical protein [Streptococcus agalactiae]